jgi:hypothetical protein
VPSHPQPADYRCCLTRHPSALLTNIFSPRPALQALEAGIIHVMAAASDGDAFPAVIVPSGVPPGVATLRI